MRPGRGQTRAWIALVALGLALSAAAGCVVPSSPTYPVDVFFEMHYSPAFRRGEPPRLDPPAGAVPITGRSPTVDLAEAARLENPVARTPENFQRATELYRVNCQPCHGASARGDGFMAPYFRQEGLRPPVDFVSLEVRALADGQIYGIITNGLGGMPPFGNLLTGDERWLLVQLVRNIASAAP